MNYIKVIRVSGSFFAREFQKKEKIKKSSQYREVDASTVLNQFKKGSSSIEVIFEDLEKDSILIDKESDPELIKKYLGTAFLEY